MTLVQDWAEDLEQLRKEDYERVLPLIKDVSDENEAVAKLHTIERDFALLQDEWKQNLETEDVLNKIWRRIEIIQSLYNTQHGYRKTRWEVFEEIAIEKEWAPIVNLIEEMKTIEANKDKKLSEATLRRLEKEYKNLLSYISTEIGMGYRGMIMREFDKRFRFYNKRISRQVEGDFGAWLKSARAEKGYSLKELEARSGVTASYIHRIEKGARKTPSIPITEKLAMALGVPPRELLSMLGRDTDDDVPGLTELISLSKFSIDGNVVQQEEKDLIVSILNTMLNEDWDKGDIWTKGSDLLKDVVRLKRQLKEEAEDAEEE